MASAAFHLFSNASACAVSLSAVAASRFSAAVLIASLADFNAADADNCLSAALIALASLSRALSCFCRALYCLSRLFSSSLKYTDRPDSARLNLAAILASVRSVLWRLRRSAADSPIWDPSLMAKPNLDIFDCSRARF